MSRNPAMNLKALRQAYSEGVTVEAVIGQCFARIAEVDDPAIFIHLRDPDAVLADARHLPARSENTPLWGVPFVIKDNIDAAGLPTTAGCPAFAYVAERDAFVVDLLKQAGAILLGKANLDQFATGLVGVRSPYGAPRNAIDPDWVPGGSSSGSAVAVAHGIAAFALGTDTAGSGRVPAALNNIVGLKPSLGALSASGVVPACRTLDTISIFANCVADAFEVFRHCAIFDAADAFAKPMSPTTLAEQALPSTIGVPSPQSQEFFGDAAHAALFERAIDDLKRGGCSVVAIDFEPFFDVAKMLYEGAWVAERYNVIEPLLRRQPQAIHPTTAKIVAPARKLSAADAFRGIYRLAELRRKAEALMAEIDLLAVPTIPKTYTIAELEADPIGPNSNLGTYTNFVNLMDMCGIAVPTGHRQDGQVGSITILGRSGQDAACASLAQLYGESAVKEPESDQG